MSCRLVVATLLAAFGTSPAFGSCTLDRVIGYTLVARKTIAGLIENGVRKDDFEGCAYDRISVFDDNTRVMCTIYSYSYSYRPTVYLFANGGNFEVCIESEFYDSAPIR
jgi:hypothetical protein